MMVNRYAIATTQNQLQKTFALEEIEGFDAIYNGFPTATLPVIVQNHSPFMANYIWGLMAKWSNNKEMSSKLYNAPLIDVLSKRTYKNSLRKRRCIIPATGFYLWKPIAKKKSIPYYFHLESTILPIAGIWEEGDEYSDDPTPNFIMLTSESDKDYSIYQQDMPLILDEEMTKLWLDVEADLSNPGRYVDLPKRKFNIHAVSPLIANTQNNFKELIEPSKPADQFGNYTLFG